MRFISYNEWQHIRRAILERTGKSAIRCPSCKGEGESDEPCPTCGQYGAECEVCEGDGKITFSTLDAEYQHKYFLSEQEYLKAILVDAKALADWMALEPAKVLIDAGFVPYSIWQAPPVGYLDEYKSKEALANLRVQPINLARH